MGRANKKRELKGGENLENEKGTQRWRELRKKRELKGGENSENEKGTQR